MKQLPRYRTNSARQLTVRLFALSALVLQASCGVKAVEMNVVVFNYTPRPLADVYVNGQHVGAGFSEYGPGGTGGSISCCFNVRAGAVKIDWVIDGPPSDPLTGKKMSSTTTLNEIGAQAAYLGVYLYADGTVQVDTAKGIPADRLPSARK
jgi:hypothetical protein